MILETVWQKASCHELAEALPARVGGQLLGVWMPNYAAYHARDAAERWCEVHWVHMQAQPDGWWLLEVHSDPLETDFYGTAVGFMAAFEDLMANIAKAGATESFRGGEE